MQTLDNLEVVIPCFNEINNLRALYEECVETHKNTGCAFILVDNGSSDGTSEFLAQVNHAGIRIVSLNKNLGYGGGVNAGLQATSKDFVGFMHADLQIKPNELQKIQAKLSYNEVIKGRRHGRNFIDLYFTLAMSSICSLIKFKPLFDINAQPTIFPRELFVKFKNPPKDFNLDLYVYWLALSNKLKVRRLSVKVYERQNGISSWNFGVRSRLKMSFEVIKYCLLELRKK